jgi:hypothetical protein
MSPSLMSPTMIAAKQSGKGDAASADFFPISGKLARAGFRCRMIPKKGIWRWSNH